MSDLMRCSECNGRKEVIGMGGMRYKCKLCDGIGWKQVSRETEQSTPLETGIVTIDPIFDSKQVELPSLKRRGRPKKDQ